jgi:hypothetical protein
MRCLPLLVLLLTSCVVRAQYLGFITYVGVDVDARVTLPDGSPPGPEFQAQLFRVMDDGTLEPLVPTTTFQTNAADPQLRYYVKPVNMIVPGISFPDLFADPIEITVRMRAWQGPDWLTSRLRGESEDVPVLIHNLLFPPANLVGMKGFVLELQPRIGQSNISTDGQFQLALSSPEPDLQTVVVERSTDLVHWTELGEFGVANNQTTFNDNAIHQDRAAFFRVRFQ